MPILLDDNVILSEKFEALEKNKKHFGHLNIGIVGLDGKGNFSDGKSADIYEEEFFKKALSGQDSVSSLYYVETLNQFAITYAIPIFEDDAETIVKSIIIFNRPSHEISDILDAIEFLKTGSASMINKEGVTIADKDYSLVEAKANMMEQSKNDSSLESVAAFEKMVVSEESGIGEYYYDGEKKVGAYERIKSAEWSICITAAYSDIMSISKVIKRISFIVMFVVIIISSVMISLYAGKLVGIIKKLVRYLVDVSKGDFSIDIEQKLLSRKDELGNIAKSIEKLIKSIGTMIGNISGIGEEMQLDSEGLYDFAQELAKSTSNIKYSISEVAQGNTNQTEQITTIAFETEEFSKKIDSMSEYTDNVKKSTMQIEKKQMNLEL